MKCFSFMQTTGKKINCLNFCTTTVQICSSFSNNFLLSENKLNCFADSGYCITNAANDNGFNCIETFVENYCNQAIIMTAFTVKEVIDDKCVEIISLYLSYFEKLIFGQEKHKKTTTGALL